MIRAPKRENIKKKNKKKKRKKKKKKRKTFIIPRDPKSECFTGGGIGGSETIPVQGKSGIRLSVCTIFREFSIGTPLSVPLYMLCIFLQEQFDLETFLMKA